ncbi:hypothetical protein EDB86DRAFT_2828048 [Lactarius hatsudake]|nr:hypothetical protein EDB86DRAFT_2828048 [Lactarius hatsudake]
MAKGVPAALGCLFGPLPVTAGQGRTRSSSAEETVSSGSALPFRPWPSIRRRFRAREGVWERSNLLFAIDLVGLPISEEEALLGVYVSSLGEGLQHPVTITVCRQSFSITVCPTWPAGSVSGDRDGYHQIRYMGQTLCARGGRQRQRRGREGKVLLACLGIDLGAGKGERERSI